MGVAITQRDVLGATMLAGVGLVFCAGGFSLGVGSLAKPGDGFLPALAGGALFVFSAIHAWHKSRIAHHAKKDTPYWPERSSPFRVGAVLLSTLFYALAFDTVGFAVATFVLFLVLLRCVDPVGWPSAVLISLATTAVAFTLFQVWLQVPLPEGWVSWWRISRWIF
jgi:hypothetical protein